MFISFKNNKIIFPESIFFIGIGGIGVSALAKLAIKNKVRVLGCDLNDSSIIQDLKKLGAKIEIGNKKINISKKNIKLIIYTQAAPKDHYILKQAKNLNIEKLSYPQALGEISKFFFTIAVSGMHGKSTTTSMIGIMLEHSGLDPLVIVGTKVKKWKGNIRIPKNLDKKTKRIFVVEADEYKSSMMHLKTDIIVLTRIEEDHLDYYKDIKHIKNEFRKYVKKISKNGSVIANFKDENIKSIVKNLNRKIIKYNTHYDKNIIKEIKKILKIAGEHNIENALAAYKVGIKLKLTKKSILKGLSKFKGTWRRMEEVGKYKIPNTKYKIPVISDYGHHPTEIIETLKAIKEKYPNKRLVLAYQPHQHNRTKTLFNKFVASFNNADILILNEIFDVAGRENIDDQNISSKDIMTEIIEKKLKDKKHIFYTKTLKQTKTAICNIVKKNDIIVIMGAGDIDKIARELV